MQPMWLVFGVALAGALLLTPLAKLAARKLRIVDGPDGTRKLQKQPVPLLGGVAVYLSLVFALVAARFSSLFSGAEFTELSNVMIAACGFVCLFGCIDDTWNLSPRCKLLLQACSVLPVVLGGFSIDRLMAADFPIALGWLGVPLTVLWLVGCINALNLLDGMDGLASVVGLSTAAMLAIIAANMGHAHVSLIAMALAGALAGFLLFNLPPASIYLGDSGSMVIGLAVGILSMQGTLKTSATLSITTPALVLTIPMLDTLLAIVRRKLTGQRFYMADRGHIHHRLLDRGLTNWQALGIIGGLCLMTGGAATVSILFRSEGLAWAIALSVVVLMVRWRVFGHHELALVKLSAAAAMKGLLGRLLTSSRFAPTGSIRPVSFASLPPGEAWNLLVDAAQRWPASNLQVSVTREGQTVASQSWRRGLAIDAAPEWSLSLTCCHGDGQRCQLRIDGSDANGPEAWHLSRISRTLRTFGNHWAAHPDELILASDPHASPRRKAA